MLTNHSDYNITMKSNTLKLKFWKNQVRSKTLDNLEYKIFYYTYTYKRLQIEYLIEWKFLNLKHWFSLYQNKWISESHIQRKDIRFQNQKSETKNLLIWYNLEWEAKFRNHINYLLFCRKSQWSRNQTENHWIKRRRRIKNVIIWEYEIRDLAAEGIRGSIEDVAIRESNRCIGDKRSIQVSEMDFD